MSKLEDDILKLMAQFQAGRLKREKKLAKELINIYEDCRKELYVKLIDARGGSDKLKIEHIESTLVDIERQLKHYTGLTSKARQSAIDEAYLFGQEFGKDVLSAGGVNILVAGGIGLIDRGAVEAVMGNIPKLAGKVEQDVLFRIRDELTRGVILGESIPKLAKRVMGTGLTQEGMKKPFPSLKTRCEVIARSEVIKASDAGYEDLAMKAQAVVGEEIYDAWITAGDDRVDSCCRAIANGTDSKYKSIDDHPGVYKRGNGPRPVISTHPRCRCRRIPYLLSWEKNGQINLNNLKGRADSSNANKKSKKPKAPVKPQPIPKHDAEINRLLNNAPLNDRLKLGRHLLDESGLTNVPVSYENMPNWGYCSLGHNQGNLMVVDMKLKKKDARPSHYGIKTVFHELTHARGHNGKLAAAKIRDHLVINREVEELVAETVSNHILKKAGFKEEICPSYSKLLVDALPRLKKHPEYASCNTVSDFGEKLAKYRYVDTDAALDELKAQLNSQNLDIKKYAVQYKQYIIDNIDDIVDKIAENNPGVSLSVIKNDVLNGWHSLNGQGFTDSLIIAMNRLGVK